MVEGVHARATGQGLHLRSLVSRTATLGCACSPMPPLGLYTGGLGRGAFAIFSRSSKKVCRHLGIGRVLTGLTAIMTPSIIPIQQRSGTLTNLAAEIAYMSSS